MYGLILTPMEQRTTFMYVSFAISLVSGGIAITATDRTFDLIKSRRTHDPLLFGYVGADGAYWQLLAMVVFFASYMALKMFALGLLIVSANRAVVPLWLVAECGLLLGVGMRIGNWRFYRRGADSAGFSLVFHFGHYIGLLAAPFPTLRNPAFLTSRVYSAGLLYMLLVNFVQVGIAYRHFGGNNTVDETTAWAILFAATVVCVMAGAVAYWYVPTSHKRTFYEHRTFKRHVETFKWNEARHGVDHKGRVLDTQEGSRACLPLWCSIHYLPVEKCKAFYEENWRRWEEEERREEQPEWFDKEFKESVPRELLPSYVSRETLSTYISPLSVAS